MSFETIKFIEKIDSDLRKESYTQYYTVLNKLCKKIDVVKVVYDKYEDDLSKASSTVSISIEVYSKLLKILLFYSLENSDIKYFNSALKLYDKVQDKLMRIEKDSINESIEKMLRIIL